MFNFFNNHWQKKFVSSKGLTLTELIVSSILVGIVMVGVVSFGFIIDEMQKTTNRSTSLSMETTALITHMTKNASLATGNKANPGIVVEDTNPANNDWISFRLDLANTPADYSDDTWFIYLRDLTADTLSTCTKPAAAGPDPTGVPACNANALQLTNKIQDIEFSFVNPDNHYTFPEMSLFVLVDITTRHSPGQPIDPLDNPEYSITTQIYPSSHSW
jgi:hypothetical protein